jgi:hypothetical protein
VDEAVRHQPTSPWPGPNTKRRTRPFARRANGPNPAVALTPQVVTPWTSWIAGTYGVDFDWTFETAGKRGNRVDVARAQANAAAAHVVTAEWKARAASAQGAARFVCGRAPHGAAGRGEREARRRVEHRIEERITAGRPLAVGDDRSRACSRRSSRLQASDAAARSCGIARASLAEALGMSTSGLAGAMFSFAAFEKAPPQRGSHRRTR